MAAIIDYINAAYPLIALKTHEPDRAEKTISHELQEGGHSCFRWDISAGLSEMAGGEVIGIDPGPLAPISWLMSNAAPDNTVLFVNNMHKFVNSIEVLQALINSRDILKSFGKAIVMVGPEMTLPMELEKSVQLMDFELPDKEALAGILQSICSDAGVDYPDSAEDLVTQAQGLTLFEAESAFALSLSSTGLQSFNRTIIIEAKAQIIKKNSSLELSHFTETFSDIGGLDNLKEFTLKTIKSNLSRGIVLLGLSGCGKSLSAKALGNETGLPTLSLDMGRLFGSLVGSSEQKTRDALAIVDAASPCILLIEEAEKSMSGAGGSGGDNGVSSRVFGAFLTWLNDHKTQVYTVCTCNSIENIPMEFLRSERFDGIFFVDLPTAEEADVILEMYKKQFNVTGPAPDISNWSPAEIRSLCRISAMMSCTLKEAAKYIVPLYKSQSEKVKEQREWAKGRCIPASSNTEKKSKKARNISSAKRPGGGQVISSN